MAGQPSRSSEPANENRPDPSELLAIYLQDHHAGATAGLELSRRAARANQDGPYGSELAAISAEIEEDVRSLERTMEDLGVPRDRRKDGAAWLGEKLGRLKRNGTWFSYSPLSRLVELEGLVVGVTGKQALWEALGAAPATTPAVTADLERLSRRAQDQRDRLEALRRRAAREAFS
jgi:hypothetical protein